MPGQSFPCAHPGFAPGNAWSPVIDVHTHVLTEEWFRLLQQHGGPRYTVQEVRGGMRAIHLDGAPFMTPVPPMFDYALRLKTMDEHGVDIGVVSLTCPNCYWGGPEVSLRAARIMNDDMIAAQTAHPDRLRWFASLPWQYPDSRCRSWSARARRGPRA